ncbi:MAG: hypothetical protein AB1801_00075 [Chloroflexota bacterium]
MMMGGAPGVMGGGSFGPGFGSFGLAGGLIGLLFNIAIIVGIVLLVVWAVKQFRSSNPGSQATSSNQPLSAREILDVRYARGS